MIKAKHELSDVEVETLGLVTSGANREEFFMLKSDASDTDKRVWKGVLAILRKALSDEYARLTELDTPNSESGVTPVEAVATENTIAEKSDEFAPVVENMVEAPVDADVVAEKSDEPALVSKETTMTDELNKSNVEMQVAELAKSNADLMSRLADAEVKLAKAEEAKERQVYLAKARTFSSLPVAPDELADHLYWLAKADTERAAWLEGVLSAVDKQMNDAAFYGEIGTSAMPVTQDEVAKAATSGDPRAALLAISPDKAREYIAAKRREIGSVR